jgi:hypothetical protein
MSDVTEIYICKDGQKLKDGKLEYSGQVENKDQAEADAKRRCAQDATIAKIAYYKVSPTGKFANFFVYDNPEAERRKRRSAAEAARAARPRAQKAPKANPSMWTRLRTMFEES